MALRLSLYLMDWAGDPAIETIWAPELHLHIVSVLLENVLRQITVIAGWIVV